MTAPVTAPASAPVGERHRRRRRRHRARWILGGFAIAAVALVGIGGVLAATRYLPALDEARAFRADLDRMVDRAQAAGLDLDRAGLATIRADFSNASDRFARLDALLSGDPLVALARVLPPTHDAVTGADGLLVAGRAVLDAADAGFALADRYVAIRDQPEAATGDVGQGGALAQLVELMATGQADTDRVVAAIDRAETAIAGLPAGLPGPLASARDELADRLRAVGPPLRAYAELDSSLPAILGWDQPRRYLVLTQNPAELRPTGGFIGSYGTITFDRGRITERAFQDVFLLDLPWDYPFVDPPPALTRYLLGPKQPWQLADANWSPHFPTSAQQAVTLYENEGGPGPIDGVLGITTYTIDEFLEITGPITVPDFGVTVAAGETTLKTLQNTRISTDPETNRKAFLSAFADRLFDVLLGLPPSRWTDLAAQGEMLRSERLILAWFADDTAQETITELGLDGAVRSDPGDFVYPVDSNVTPASKLSAVTDRELELTVRLDAVGNALNELTVRWTNRIESDAARPFRELPGHERSRTLGMYFRLYVPERSRVEEVSAGTEAPITSPSDVADESGRMVIANYFRIPAGSARLSYSWTSPYPADLGEDGIVTYRLTIQKQPGLRAEPLSLRIAIPDGATIVEMSPGLVLAGQSATVQTTFERDVVAVIRYRPASEEAQVVGQPLLYSTQALGTAFRNSVLEAAR